MTTGLASRRKLLKDAGSALAAMTVFEVQSASNAFAQTGGQVIPWLDQPPPNPAPAALGNLLNWETLNSLITPSSNFFSVNHYGRPEALNDATWRVDIAGLVARPRSLTMADIRARPLRETEYTLECSGNSAFPFFIGGIGNARWGGTPLAPLLESAGILREATEVIFWGADSGPVTVRDNSGVTSAGETATGDPDTTGGLDLTFTEYFARSMSVADALSRENLLCYQLNGDPLPPENGYPVRLIAPGWYGVANVKWLSRIEFTDHRFTGRFMARDYVTIREEKRNGKTVWTFANVGPARLKSAPAKVTRFAGGSHTIMGAAWGAPIARVEVQINGGPWMPATLEGNASASPRGRAWRFWTYNWGNPAPAEYSIASRAIDTDGNVQPAPTDPFLAAKRTYWEANGQIIRRVRVGG